jgi:hypothetical protein
VKARGGNGRCPFERQVRRFGGETIAASDRVLRERASAGAEDVVTRELRHIVADRLCHTSDILASNAELRLAEAERKAAG